VTAFLAVFGGVPGETFCNFLVTTADLRYALPLGEHPRQEQDSSTQHPLHTPYVNVLSFLNKLKALAHPRRAGRTYTYPVASAFANATRTDVRGCRSCAEKQRGVWPIAPFPIARRPGESLSP